MLAAAYPEHAAELRHCHQLDYATSGVMCYALSRRAASAAGWLFEHRHTRKVYLAVLRGHLEAARMECELPIADDPSHSFKMMVGTDEVPGRPAQTVVSRLATSWPRHLILTRLRIAYTF
jgi:23S rRNA-/tRNA-specific pseudouridylate synthase